MIKKNITPISTKAKGSDLRLIFSKVVSTNSVATYRFAPSGGVSNPISQAMIKTIPKKTGSIPSWLIIGRKIGVRIMTCAMVSIHMPIKSSKNAIKTLQIVHVHLQRRRGPEPSGAHTRSIGICWLRASKQSELKYRLHVLSSSADVGDEIAPITLSRSKAIAATAICHARLCSH